MSIFRMRRVAVIGAAASAVLLLAQTTTVGAAGAGAGVVVGSGTISPALAVNPQPVSGGFAGTSVGAGAGTGAGAVVQVAGACNFSFHSEGYPGGPGDSLALGNGDASGSCTGGVGGGSLSAPDLDYFRVGSVVEIDGDGTACGTSGCEPVGFLAVCVFAPTSNPPSSFALACEVTITPIEVVEDPDALLPPPL